ncbi:hypothetical protein SBOR_5465 [Sclerotinia borealis F-4128]|uniref:Uncharacterized protein n=1 Tax=Sclerotinia borealis (strain F-4128) TaxID=1432307 RepID=W9CHC5_SCLBF|nr:hypothetical protein SBOR_5465 [Sclerotinia borealis F-4128]
MSKTHNVARFMWFEQLPACNSAEEEFNFVAATRNKHIHLRDSSGYTGLAVAARRGLRHIVVALLRLGANPNTKSGDGTSLRPSEIDEYHISNWLPKGLYTHSAGQESNLEQTKIPATKVIAKRPVNHAKQDSQAINNRGDVVYNGRTQPSSNLPSRPSRVASHEFETRDIFKDWHAQTYMKCQAKPAKSQTVLVPSRQGHWYPISPNAIVWHIILV